MYMKPQLLISLLVLSTACYAQGEYTSVPLRSQTVAEHTKWIIDVYTDALHLSARQSQWMYESISAAYLEVPLNEFYSKVKGSLELELLQAPVIHEKLQAKLPGILTAGQRRQFQAMPVRPEDCFSLSKAYTDFSCCPSFSK